MDLYIDANPDSMSLKSIKRNLSENYIIKYSNLFTYHKTFDI